MRCYNQPHRFYCGVDLHARSLFIHVLDAQGQDRLRTATCPPRPPPSSTPSSPSATDLVVGCECMFAWYWLADLCEDERIPFVLGHALAMKAIHGGKAKNDRIDAAKLAGLLRGGLFPMAYVYPQGQAADPRPAPPPLLLRPPAGPADRPHRQHQQPVQPAAAVARSSPTPPTAPPRSPTASTDPSTRLDRSPPTWP